MAGIKVAVQLYSVREDCARDLAGSLARIARMGYEGVEFAGYHGHGAADIRRMLDDNGLAAAGAHVGLPTLLGDELPRTVEFNRTLGNRFLIVPGLPAEYTASIAAWQRTAGVFNEVAARLRPLGLFTGYHNHHTEFARLDGQMPWEVFLAGTRDEVVMQADTGNARHAGVDVIPYIEKHPGRARTVHLKEHSVTNDKAVIGEGDVDWARLFTACRTVGGTEWYIVEQESYAYPPMECIDRCRQALRGMGV